MHLSLIHNSLSVYSSHAMYCIGKRGGILNILNTVTPKRRSESKRQMGVDVRCSCSSYLRRRLPDLHPRPLIDAPPPRPPARPAGGGGRGGGGGGGVGGGGHQGGGHVVGGAPQPLGQVGRRDGVGHLLQHISACAGDECEPMNDYRLCPRPQ